LCGVFVLTEISGDRLNRIVSVEHPGLFTRVHVPELLDAPIIENTRSPLGNEHVCIFEEDSGFHCGAAHGCLALFAELRYIEPPIAILADLIAGHFVIFLTLFFFCESVTRSQDDRNDDDDQGQDTDPEPNFLFMFTTPRGLSNRLTGQQAFATVRIVDAMGGLVV